MTRGRHDEGKGAMKAKTLGSIALATLMLLILCVVAGRPQVFSDTKSYYALGQEVAGALGPTASPTASTVALRGHALPPAEARAATRLAYTVSASRSPYWSVLLYLAASLGTAWLVVVAQALVAAVILWIALRALGVAHAYLPIVAGLALLSSLPVEVMFVMPDLFAGLTILAALALLVGRARLTRAEAVALWLTMAAGALFHTSHLLVLGTLGAGTLLIALAIRRARGFLPPGVAMLTAAVVALIGASAFPFAVRAIRGEPIYAPPFVAARLIADGPGRQLLRTDCADPQAGGPQAWGWCPYARLPLDDVNTILWNTSPRFASFQAADYDRRVRIIGEQGRFALAVVRRYPGEVARTVLSNVGHLFLRYGTDETLGDPTQHYRDPRFAIFTRLVPDTGNCATGRASCAPRIDVALLDAVIGWALLASIAAVAMLLATARQPSPRRCEWSTATAFLLAGLVLNALICGGISGNAERYQSRITWLIPLLAGAMLADRMANRRTSRPFIATIPSV